MSWKEHGKIVVDAEVGQAIDLTIAEREDRGIVNTEVVNAQEYQGISLILKKEG